MQEETANRLDKDEELTLDVDLRLELLIRSLWDDFSDDEVRNIAMGWCRAAYGQGYIDALKEKTRGQLCKKHGYRVPIREV